MIQGSWPRSFGDGESPSPAQTGARTAPHLWKLDVLVVEDDPADSRLILDALSNHPNVGVAYATDRPDVALRALAAGEFIPDLVLLDVHMPRIDGFQFLESVRRIPDMAGVSIVFLTNTTLGKDIVDSGLCSAASYILKPATYSALKDCVDDVIRRLIRGDWTR